MTRAVALLLCLAGCAPRSAGPSLARDWVGVESAGGGGDLRLECQPADAEVFLDGVGQGTCLDFSRRGLSVGAGLHRVEVKKQGYLPYLTYYEPSGANASLAPELRPASGSQGESR